MRDVMSDCKTAFARIILAENLGVKWEGVACYIFREDKCMLTAEQLWKQYILDFFFFSKIN